MSCRLLCFHGFLGGPQDFDFLKDSYQVKAINLRDFVHLAFDDLFEKLQSIGAFENVDIILGYSFGARLALRLKILKQLKQPLFCIGGHLGLKDKEEIFKRKAFEDNIIERIQSLSEANFLHFWNSFELFEYDKPLASVDMRNAELFFANYGLSKQEYLLDFLSTAKNIHFLYGENDSKYLDYARTKLGDFDFEILADSGHRALTHHDAVKNWLKEKL